MTKTLQLKRGTTTANNAYTGSVGEITVDTTTNSLRIHDGTTAGGHPVTGSGDGIETIKLNGVAQTVTDKTVDLSVQEPINSSNKLSASLVDDSSTANKKFVTTTEKNTWNGKQDSISDLGTIRTNATEALKQKSTLPTASSTELGKIYQFTGTTTASYTNGYIYQCNEHEIESSYTKEVVSGSLSVDWIYVTLETFEETYSTTGDYTFSYDGENWSISGDTVDLGTIGIGIGGPTENGDSFTIHYVAAHTEYAWDGIQVSDLSSKQDVLTAGANITLDGATISASSYTDALMFMGIQSNPETFGVFNHPGYQTPDRITSGPIYYAKDNNLVAVEEVDTETTFANDMPYEPGKTHVLFYGEDLISTLGVEKNYIWVDENKIKIQDTGSAPTDEECIWIKTQYGGGYLKGIYYTNDGGTTWADVTLPLLTVSISETNQKSIVIFNKHVNGYKAISWCVAQTTSMIPYGRTATGAINYGTQTVSSFVYLNSNYNPTYNGYFCKVPWGSAYYVYYSVTSDGDIMWYNSEGSTQKAQGYVVPFVKWSNGKAEAVADVVAISDLQTQVNNLDAKKADRKEVEVVNSKVEAGIVFNPKLVEYTVSGRTLTVTGGHYWIPYNRPGDTNDIKNEIPTDRQGGMAVTIPAGVTTKQMLYENLFGSFEDWKWDYIGYNEDVFYPSASDDDRYMDSSSTFRLYAKQNPTTLEKVYTKDYDVYDGARLFKVVELENHETVTQYVGRVNNISSNTEIHGYVDLDGVEHECYYRVHSDVYEKVGQEKDTVLTVEYNPNSDYDDPRQTPFMYVAALSSGSNPNPFGYIYWDGEKFVDQKSIVVVGSRITIFPDVRAVMYNGTDANDLPSMLDYTVPESIVSYMTPEMSGTYNVIITNQNTLLFSKNIRVDIPTNTFYVDNVAVVGCKIGTIVVHNMFIEDWVIDSPYRLVTQEQLQDAVANIDKVKSQTTGYVKFWTGTQADYDLIVTKDANTLYIIVPASNS